MKKFLNAYFENILQAAEKEQREVFDLMDIDCRFCPFRAECRKAAESGEDESTCAEFIRKMVESR
jgi:hypothetical protein